MIYDSVFPQDYCSLERFLLRKYQGRRTGKLESFEPEVVSAAVISEAVVGMLIFVQSLVPFQVL